MKIKLTQPQQELLNQCNSSPQPVVDYHPPAKQLVKKGLCEWKCNGYRNVLSITEEGKKYIKP